MPRIAHVKVIRVHTRVPIADPARITPELVRALKAPGKATYVVLHANHARELTDAAREACARLVDAGIPMLSQSVLLTGVNDDPQALGALMRALVECRIKPYYLHHGDLASGTSHLRTSIERGQDLMRALRGRVSGLCQPTYVLDIPGGHGKSPIGPNYLVARRRGPLHDRGLQRSAALLSAAEVIRLLELGRTPRADTTARPFAIPAKIADGRAASTAIYFLLARGERSHWHRVDAVEVWHWYAGAPLQLADR